MLQNLHDKSAEFTWVPLAIVSERLLYTDYLPILARAYGGIFIPSKGNSEDIDWKLYTGSFTMQLWQGLLLTSFLTAVSVFIMEWISMRKQPVNKNTKSINFIYMMKFKIRVLKRSLQTVYQ